MAEFCVSKIDILEGDHEVLVLHAFGCGVIEPVIGGGIVPAHRMEAGILVKVSCPTL
jgi:hypothetical protein